MTDKTFTEMLPLLNAKYIARIDTVLRRLKKEVKTLKALPLDDISQGRLEMLNASLDAFSKVYSCSLSGLYRVYIHEAKTQNKRKVR